jgi:hypothetical protein
MQSDGNLVLYRLANHHALWATGTNGQDVKRAIMQGDGNLVLYTFDGQPVWASNTAGKIGSFLVMQNDGNVVIYQPNVPVWASETNQRFMVGAARRTGIVNPIGEPAGGTERKKGA